MIYVIFNVQQLADLHDYFCIILESYDLRRDLQVLQESQVLKQEILLLAKFDNTSSIYFNRARIRLSDPSE